MELGDRMKEYEGISQNKLIRRIPTIIRIDGKAFHTFTRGLEKPFCKSLHDLMINTTRFLIENIQNAVFGYTQSDEISILLNDWGNTDTEQWFGAKVQKITSVSASLATAYFNKYWQFQVDAREMAFFDSRCFNVPYDEVVNYFIWRQQDAERNSVQSLGQALFSHKHLHGKNCEQIKKMLIEDHDVNWDDLDGWKKRGSCVFKQTKVNSDKPNEHFEKETIIFDTCPPKFIVDREYVASHLI